MNICVFGAASDNVAQIYKDKVYEMGRTLAQNGYDMVFGAGGTGLMGSAAAGFYDGEAEVTGVIPRFFKNISREPIFENCNKIIKTDTMRERKRVMDESADAFIIVPGGIGTLDETFEILTLKQLNQLDKPIIFYNINGFYNELFGYINNHIVGEQFANGDINSLFSVCDNVSDIVLELEKSAEN